MKRGQEDPLGAGLDEKVGGVGLLVGHVVWGGECDSRETGPGVPGGGRCWAVGPCGPLSRAAQGPRVSPALQPPVHLLGG